MLRAPGTYIDNLAVDVRRIIVRKLSDAPRLSQWRRYLTPSTILFLFHPQGPFRNDLGTVFSVLSIGRRNGLVEDKLEMASEEAEILDVFKYLGDGLKHLIYGTKRNLYRNLSYVVSPLKCLELWVIRLPDCSFLPWVQIICQFASSLETLVLDGYCDEFPSFSVFHFPHLKEFHVSTGFDCADLIPVLGGNLEIFGCRNSFPESRQLWKALVMLPSISTELREIDVPLPSYFSRNDIRPVQLQDIFASCLLSYRAQLTKVRMDILSSNPILCHRVLRMCPNMVCTIHSRYIWDNLNDIQMLAPRIRKLQFCCRLFVSMVPEFIVPALNRFDNLDELEIYNLGILDTAFPIPLATLRNLRIENHPSHVYNYEEPNILRTKVLYNLLRSVTSLQTLEVTTWSFEDEKAFFPLLNSNSTLKIVRVTLQQPVKQQLALQIVQCMLKAMISHQRLEELKIEFRIVQSFVDSEFFGMVNDFVQPYRFKRTHIEVQRRRYFH